MKQWLRLKDGKLTKPRQLSGSLKKAKKAWGDGNSVEVDINSTFNADHYDDNLTAGKVTISSSKVATAQAVKDKKIADAVKVSDLHSALMAIDPDGESGTVKIMLKYLQGVKE